MDWGWEELSMLCAGGDQRTQIANIFTNLLRALVGALNTLLKDATSYCPTHLLRNLQGVLKRLLDDLAEHSNLLHFGHL